MSSDLAHNASIRTSAFEAPHRGAIPEEPAIDDDEPVTEEIAQPPHLRDSAADFHGWYAGASEAQSWERRRDASGGGEVSRAPKPRSTAAESSIREAGRFTRERGAASISWHTRWEGRTVLSH